jgi:flagellar hook assembly protein FlgD
LIGQSVKPIVKAAQQPGEYSFSWHGDDEHERPVASGIYVVRVRLSAGNEEFTIQRKLSLLR